MREMEGDGYISDDSSFVGDEEQKDLWASLGDDFDPQQYWRTHSRLVNILAATSRRKHNIVIRSGTHASGDVSGSDIRHSGTMSLSNNEDSPLESSIPPLTAMKTTSKLMRPYHGTWEGYRPWVHTVTSSGFGSTVHTRPQRWRGTRSHKISWARLKNFSMHTGIEDQRSKTRIRTYFRGPSRVSSRQIGKS